MSGLRRNQRSRSRPSCALIQIGGPALGRSWSPTAASGSHWGAASAGRAAGAVSAPGENPTEAPSDACLRRNGKRPVPTHSGPLGAPSISFAMCHEDLLLLGRIDQVTRTPQGYRELVDDRVRRAGLAVL